MATVVGPPVSTEDTQKTLWQASELARHVLILGALLPVGLWAVWPLLGVSERPIAPSLWVLVVVSALSNLSVLRYHYVTPPHPKFVMLRTRKFWLRVHIISGSLEFLFGIVMLLLPGQAWPGIMMAICALGFHVPSSLAQNRIVAGSRAIMVPMYIAGITVHGFCAAMLLAHPTSRFWAVNTFLLFNTYAWVRIYGALFQTFDLFSTSRYTVMVMAAGVTTMSPVLGPIWPLQLTLFLGTYVVLYRLLVARTPADYQNFVREHSRWSSVSDEAVALWSIHQRSPEQRKRAKQIFDFFDKNGTGRLDVDALQRLFTTWALPKEAWAAFRAQFEPQGLDFETFFEKLWSLTALRDQAAIAVTVQTPTSLRDKARFIFDMLDLNQDGQLQTFEVRLLLLEWNLPPEETEKYFASFDRNRNGTIDFDEFFAEMKPVWQYLYYNVMHTKVASGNLLAGMTPRTADDDELLAKKLHERTRSELVGKVAFLRTAPPAFLAELADSFVTLNVKAGEPIIVEFSEGDLFYILVEGEAQVTCGGEHLTDLKPGASFGESALLLDTRRNASVTALTDCLLYAISRPSFKALAGKYPELQDHLQRLVDAETKRRVRASLASLLQIDGTVHRTDALVDLLSARLQERRYVADDVLIQEGDDGDSMFIIQSGHVSVRRNGAEVGRCGSGDYLGEMSLLTGARRNATVIATEPTTAFTLSRKDFEVAMAESAEFQAQILQRQSARAASAAG